MWSQMSVVLLTAPPTTRVKSTRIINPDALNRFAGRSVFAAALVRGTFNFYFVSRPPTFGIVVTVKSTRIINPGALNSGCGQGGQEHHRYSQACVSPIKLGCLVCQPLYLRVSF